MKCLFATLLLSTCLFAQQASGPLTNQRIAELVHNGVRQDEIIRLIQTAPSISFDLTPVGEDVLMKAGVSEDVIKAMAAREQGAPYAPEVAAPTASPFPSGKPNRPPDAGEYIHRGSKDVSFSGAAFIPHTSAGDAIGIGSLRVGYFIAQSLELGADFSVAAGGGGQVYLPAGFVRFVAHTANPRVFPFFGVEAGEVIGHADGTTDTAFGAKGEVGVKYFVSRNVSIDTAYNLFYMHAPDAGFSESTASVITIGFALTF